MRHRCLGDDNDGDDNDDDEDEGNGVDVVTVFLDFDGEKVVFDNKSIAAEVKRFLGKVEDNPLDLEDEDVDDDDVDDDDDDDDKVHEDLVR